MKKLIGLIIGSMFVVSCATMGVVPCTLYERFEATPTNSLIASKISDPCAANRILTLAAKLPVIYFEKEYIDQFNTWADHMKLVIKTGISYKGIQDMIVMEIAKLNLKAGLTLFIISDGILVFDNDQMILPKDVELLTALIDNLKDEVNALRVMI